MILGDTFIGMCRSFPLPEESFMIKIRKLGLILTLLITSLMGLSACGGGSSGGGGGSGGSSLPTMNIAEDSSGNGWVSLYGQNEIEEYSGSSSNQVLVKTIFLNNPLGLAFDGSGNLWIANNQSISEYNPSRTLITTVSTSGTPDRMTLCGGDLWVTFKNSNTIAEYNPTNGQQIYSFIPSGTPRSITCDSSGNLWVDYSNTNIIQEYNPLSSNAGPINTITPPNNPYGIAYCAGYLWVTNSNSNTIEEINPASGSVIYSYTDPSGLTAENITANSGSCSGVWYAIPLPSGSTDSSGNLLTGEFKLFNVTSRQLIVAYGVLAPTSSSGGGGGGGSVTATGSGTWTTGVCPYSSCNSASQLNYVCSYSGNYSFPIAISGTNMTTPNTNGTFTGTLTHGVSGCSNNASLSGLNLSGSISGNSINLTIVVPANNSNYSTTGTGTYNSNSISGVNVPINFLVGVETDTIIVAFNLSW